MCKLINLDTKLIKKTKINSEKKKTIMKIK